MSVFPLLLRATCSQCGSVSGSSKHCERDKVWTDAIVHMKCAWTVELSQGFGVISCARSMVRGTLGLRLAVIVSCVQEEKGKKNRNRASFPPCIPSGCTNEMCHLGEIKKAAPEVIIQLGSFIKTERVFVQLMVMKWLTPESSDRNILNHLLTNRYDFVSFFPLSAALMFLFFLSEKLRGAWVTFSQGDQRGAALITIINYSSRAMTWNRGLIGEHCVNSKAWSLWTFCDQYVF